jgi:hypothetical protein
VEIERKLVTPRPQYSQDSRSGGRESNPERVDLEAGMQSSQLLVMSQPVFFSDYTFFFWHSGKYFSIYRLLISVLRCVYRRSPY